MEEIIQSEIFRNAFLGGSLTAVLCAAVGYFMVLRALAFASEALTDIGFAGATGSALLGLSPFWGMLGLGLLAVLTLGALGTGEGKGRGSRDGFILRPRSRGPLPQPLFSFERRPCIFRSAHSLRFPHEPVRLPPSHPPPRGLCRAPRPCNDLRLLLFASIDPDSARAKGVPIKALDYAFLVLLAATTVVSIEAIGVLLAFALISAPAGAARGLDPKSGPVLCRGPAFGPRHHMVRHRLGFLRAMEQNTRGGLHRDLLRPHLWACPFEGSFPRPIEAQEANRHNEREIHE